MRESKNNLNFNINRVVGHGAYDKGLLLEGT